MVPIFFSDSMLAVPCEATIVDQDQAAAGLAAWISEEGVKGAPDCDAVALQGGAGSGKTHTVSRTIWDALDRYRNSFQVIVAAPTHKALGVIRSRVEDEGARRHGQDAPLRKCGRKSALKWLTVASLAGDRMIRLANGRLQSRPGTGRDEHAGANLIVIDESSMVRLETARRIRKAYPDSLILLVGDPAQLPPITSGTVIDAGDAFGLARRILVLAGNRRAQAQGPLVRIYEHLRDPDVALNPEVYPGLCRLMEGDVANAVNVVTSHDVFHRRLAEHIRSSGRKPTILAWQNQSVLRHNRALHKHLFGGSEGFCEGEPVISLETWPPGPGAARLYNSERLTVVRAGKVTRSRLLGQSIQRLVVHSLDRPDADDEDIVCPLDDFAFEMYMQKRGDALDSELSALQGTLDFPGSFENFRSSFSIDTHPEVDATIVEIAITKGMPAGPGVKGDRENRSGQARAWLRERRCAAIEAAWRKSLSLHQTRREFAPLRHGYAMTNHRAQGSTIEHVCVDMFDLMKMPEREERARAIYTAVTRASQKLMICWLGRTN